MTSHTLRYAGGDEEENSQGETGPGSDGKEGNPSTGCGDD
ncbi:hypothetical protein GCM10010361_78560 [Streptomyces olivaceiscleroticus]|uniref:Uncharacterized protein n=1 Tax=Streptomyces olivaceiscleroticus TaxID=68245 RepID=A0ABN1BMN6_9ACTN